MTCLAIRRYSITSRRVHRLGQVHSGSRAPDHDLALLRGLQICDLGVASVGNELAKDAEVHEDLEGSAGLEGQRTRVGHVVRELVEVSAEPDEDQKDPIRMSEGGLTRGRRCFGACS